MPASCVRMPNGPAMLSATSIFFVTRRDSKAGLIREMISLSGRTIWRSSLSLELSNNPGRAVRSSPKDILTEPWASCETAFSTGMGTQAPGGGVWISLSHRSIGNKAMTDDSGNCRSPVPETAAARAGENGIGAGAAAAGADWGAGAAVFRTNVGGNSSAVRVAGAGAGSGVLADGIGTSLAGVCGGVKAMRGVCMPNGPEMLSATSIFFAARRGSKAGVIREMISLSGRAI